MYFKKIGGTLSRGLSSYCCVFTAVYYTNFFSNKPFKIDLQFALIYIIIFFIFDFVKSTDKSTNKGEYDYKDGKLIFKERRP